LLTNAGIDASLTALVGRHNRETRPSRVEKWRVAQLRIVAGRSVQPLFQGVGGRACAHAETQSSNYQAANDFRRSSTARHRWWAFGNDRLRTSPLPKGGRRELHVSERRKLRDHVDCDLCCADGSAICHIAVRAVSRAGQPVAIARRHRGGGAG